MNKTVLIKLSGESLSGKNGHGLDFDYIKEVCLRIKRIHDKGVYIGIVCGGGNFLRGRDTHAMNRETADYVGMLATVMNSLVLKDMFLQLGCKAYNQSGLSVKIIDDVDSDKAKKALLDGNVVIFGGGTGKPSFTIQASGRQAPIHPAGEPMVHVGKDKYIFSDGEENNRRLSVKEIARIQTFPDWYEFSRGTSNRNDNAKLDLVYKQIGNAVPVRLALAVAEPIAVFAKELLEKEKEEAEYVVIRNVGEQKRMMA